MKSSPGPYPQRIICLTAETTELLYALGVGDRVVGVSGFAIRPPEARQKPRVGAFTSAKTDKILELNPDLVLCFSDLQADIAKDLIKKGVNVLTLNQRSLAETTQTALWLGGLLGIEKQAQRYVGMFEEQLQAARDRAKGFARKPTIYFEEWDEPMISGIRWVAEILDVAGGKDIFPELAQKKVASQRYVQPAEVIARNPDIILASWCGKKAQLDKIVQRPGWDKIKAVATKQVFEIKSPDILQPGPSLLRGLRQIQTIIENHVLGHCEPFAALEGKHSEAISSGLLRRPEASSQ